MKPFDSPDGSVWRYVYPGFGDCSRETLFVVLPARFDYDVNGTFPYTVQNRQYLNLITGEIEWFAKGSPLNDVSERFA